MVHFALQIRNTSVISDDITYQFTAYSLKNNRKLHGCAEKSALRRLRQTPFYERMLGIIRNTHKYGLQSFVAHKWGGQGGSFYDRKRGFQAFSVHDETYGQPEHFIVIVVIQL